MRPADVARIGQALRTSAVRIGAEVFAAAALIVGWYLLTAAIAEIAPARIVWRTSAGLFLLSCFGWRLLFTMARDGLYQLSADEKTGTEGRRGA